MSHAPGGVGNPLDILTIVSNVFFLLSAVQAWIGEIWVLVALYVLIVINSSMYHACNSFAHTCVFPSLTHRMMDFFFAQLIIPATAFTLILMPRKLRGLQTMSFIFIAFVIFTIQQAVGESIYIQMAIAIGSLVAILVYWLIYAVHQASTTYTMSLPPYDWGYLLMGVSCTATACSLYASEMQYHLLYWAVHSCWHAIAAYGQIFIIKCRPSDPDNKYVVLNGPVANVSASSISKRRQFVHTAPKARV